MTVTHRPLRTGLLLTALLALLTGPLVATAGFADDTEMAAGSARLQPRWSAGQMSWFESGSRGKTLRIADRRSYELPDSPAHRTLGAPGERAWLSGVSGDDAAAPSLTFALVRPAEPDIALNLDEVIAPEGGVYQAYTADGDTADGSWEPATETEGLTSPMLGTGRDAEGREQSRSVILLAGVGSSTDARYRHRFTAPGMYCVSYTATALFPRMPERMTTPPQRVRFAVGDSVPIDAPCGTAGGGPGESPEPEPTEPEPTEPEPTEPQPGDIYVMRTGHADVVAPRIVGEGDDRRLEIRAHVDGQGSLDYRDVVIHQNARIKTPVPADGSHPFMGDPGQEIWNSPQATSADLGTRDFAWIGSSTEDRALVANGSLTDMTIEQIASPDGGAAPGQLAVWQQSGSNAPNVLVNTRSGISGPGLPATLSSAAVSNHSHYHWTFTEPGVYCLAVSAQTEIGGELQVVRDWLTLAVGDQTDPATATPCARTLPAPSAPAAPAVDVADAAPAHVVPGTRSVSMHPTLDHGLTIADWRPGTSEPTRFVQAEDAIVHATEPQYQATQPPLLRSLGLLGTDMLGMPRGSGPMRVTFDEARGPGSVSFRAVELDSPREFTLRPGSGVIPSSTWRFGSPGKYCIDTSWADRHGYDESATLTLVVDGRVDPGDPASPIWKGADNGALDRSCANGGTPIDPKDDDEPGPDDPSVPDRPDAPTAEADGTDMAVSWQAPGDGGSPITGYAIALTSIEGRVLSRRAAADDTDVVFGSVPAGRWTATLIADNRVGSSAPSPQSDPVTIEDGADDGDHQPPGGIAPVPDAALTDELRGGVTVPATAAPGETIAVRAGERRAGLQVRIWLHSDPTLLSTRPLGQDGAALVTIPSDARPGHHRVVVQQGSGALLGWDDLEIVATSRDTPAGTDADGNLADDAHQGPAGGSGKRGNGELPSTGAEPDTTELLAAAFLLTLLGAVAAAIGRHGAGRSRPRDLASERTPR